MVKLPVSHALMWKNTSKQKAITIFTLNVPGWNIFTRYLDK